jgi:phosphate transport system protein
MADHILKKIDADITALRERIASMAGAVDTQWGDAMTLIEKCYLERGLAVDKLEERVDELHLQVDRECTHFIALHQPNAGDLRAVLGMSRIAADLEAMGNLACRAARAGERVHKHSRKQVPALAELMALHARAAGVLRASIAAITQLDGEQALLAAQQVAAIQALAASLARQLRDMLAEGAERVDPLLETMVIVQALADMAEAAGRAAGNVAFISRGVDLRHANAAQIEAALLPAA